jgi:hypothetical protein
MAFIHITSATRSGTTITVKGNALKSGTCFLIQAGIELDQKTFDAGDFTVSLSGSSQSDEYTIRAETPARNAQIDVDFALAQNLQVSILAPQGLTVNGSGTSASKVDCKVTQFGTTFTQTVSVANQQWTAAFADIKGDDAWTLQVKKPS